ncbi:MAG: ABC transporter ATP-binding protein [Pseudomonadota bacterium]
MTDAVLVANRLSVDRGGASVLRDVDFSVARGEVFALLGGNGAGKSTTLLTLLGFVDIASGEALVNGLRVQDHVMQIREQVAYLPESTNLYKHLSARENLDYLLSVAGLKRTADEIDAHLDTVSLASDAWDRPLSNYSKGMRQKVAIALAMLRRTSVLLLDEPTSGLDPVAIDEFNAIVSSLAANGTTVLMVTHDVYGACQVAGRVGLLQHGRMVGLFEADEDAQISAQAVHRMFAEHTSR